MSVGLSPGRQLPDFELPDDAGTIRRLSELQGDDLMKVYVGYWFWRRPAPYRLRMELQKRTRRVKADYDPTVPAIRADWERSRAAAVDAARGGR